MTSIKPLTTEQLAQLFYVPGMGIDIYKDHKLYKYFEEYRRRENEFGNFLKTLVKEEEIII